MNSPWPRHTTRGVGRPSWDAALKYPPPTRHRRLRYFERSGWGPRGCPMAYLIIGLGWTAGSLLAALLIGRAMWGAGRVPVPGGTADSSVPAQSAQLPVGHVDDAQPLLGSIANVARSVDQVVGVVGLDEAAMGSDDLIPLGIDADTEDRIVV